MHPVTYRRCIGKSPLKSLISISFGILFPFEIRNFLYLIVITKTAFLSLKFEPEHDKINKIACVPSKDIAQSDQSLCCQHEETLYPRIPIKSTAKTLIRLCRCPCWSESSLGAIVIWLVLSCCGLLKQVAQRATIAHLSPMCQGQISFQKIRTHPSFNACSCYMKVSKGSNQKQQRKSGNTIFPIKSLWGIS